MDREGKCKKRGRLCLCGWFEKTRKRGMTEEGEREMKVMLDVRRV